MSNADVFAFLDEPTTATATPPADNGNGAAAVATAEPVASVRRGTTTHQRSRLPVYIDIETIPDESRMELFWLEPLPTVGERTAAADMMPADQLRTGSLEDIRQVLASRRPDDEYLAALEAAEKSEANGKKGNRKGLFEAIDDLRGESAKVAAAVAERQKLMSVTPEFCRVVALGWAVGNDPSESMVFGQPTADGRGTLAEVNLLERFWSLIAVSGAIVGYNVAGFDLPVLFVRSIILGVDSSRKLDLRPWGSDVCDLMQQRFPKGGQRKLKDLARIMGIPVPAGDVDGSQVAELFRTDPVKLGEYVRSDVSITRALHQKYRGTFV